jgi:hypothetical protein
VACHKGLLADVEARMATAPAGARFPAAPEDRILLAFFVLHTADLCARGAVVDLSGNERDQERTRERVITATIVACLADTAASIPSPSLRCRCNPLFPPDVSQRNAANLGAEFSAQAAAERARGLPPSVPVPASERERARGELGFIRHVVQPLYGALAKLAPDTRLPCGALIEANAAAWAAIAGVRTSTGAIAH